jgi:protein-disulfide isomerase
LVDEALLEAEARDRGLDSVDELLVMEVEERVPPLDESAIQRMYPDIERENPGLTLEEARPRIERGLRRRSHADRYRVFIEELRSKSAVEQRLPYPELPRVPVVVTEHDPILGPVDAPVTVVQFAEYECFYCTQMQPVIDRVRQQWPDQVRVVFKDFPLTGHGRAVPAAVAAHCAGEQGRFWSFHQEMMSNQGAVSERDLTEHATVTGLDPERFAACRSSGRHEAGIFDDLAMGREHGVRATPTFFINGTLLAGMQSFERLEDVIRRELR